MGQIAAVQPLGDTAAHGKRLVITPPAGYLDDVGLGDSIALNGACMTVTTLSPDTRQFTVDISAESLLKTTGLDTPGPINMEKALRANDRLGGHLVSGHVDDVAQIVSLTPVGESFELIFAAPLKSRRYLADKGSVTLNGTSLTVNRVWADETNVFGTINLIPHTMAHTVFQYLSAGDAINFEVDLLARYVAQLMNSAD